MTSPVRGLDRLNREVIACTRCPRLVRHCRTVAREKVRRFADQDYWGKPLPSFGDPHARLLIVGLAPAAHGGNRTGRMFTGDRSGDALFLALYRASFANQALSVARDDGLLLTDCRITATLRCAPPLNKPTADEIANCAGYLDRELTLVLPQLRVVVALGKIGFDNFSAALRRLGHRLPQPFPKFGHGVEVQLGPGRPVLIGSFHPSQQNMFTGRLTQDQLDAVFRRARKMLGT
jgi:uracil-DNA glycosylase family 4